MHKIEAISTWKSKQHGARVRAAWRIPPKRTVLLSKWRKSLLGKVQHLDTKSKHAQFDHATYANAYRCVRSFLDTYPTDERPTPLDNVAPTAVRRRGGKDWAGHFGPVHEIIDENESSMTPSEFVDLILKGSFDKFGRPRRNVARRGILNPITSIQKMLRHLALNAPKRANDLLSECTRFLRTRLRAEFPDVPMQLAMHIGTGRPHWEWIIPKYHHAGKLVRAKVDWDGPRRTIQHAEAFARNHPSPSGHAPKLNSVIERELYQMIVKRYQRAEKELDLRLPTEVQMLASEIFFLELQQASLMDGTQSRSPKRSRLATKTCKRNEATLAIYREKMEKAKEKQKLRPLILAALSALPGMKVLTPHDWKSVRTYFNTDAQTGGLVGGMTPPAMEMYANDPEILTASSQHLASFARAHERREKLRLAKAGLNSRHPQKHK